MQKDHHHDAGEDQPQQNGIPDAPNGILHNSRLVIKRSQMNTRRKYVTNAVYLGVDFVGNDYGVAVRLPVDVEQHSRLTLSPHDGVDGLDCLLHLGDIAYANRNACGRVLDYRLLKIGGATGLAIDQS